jgi:hypothetical protein
LTGKVLLAVCDPAEVGFDVRVPEVGVGDVRSI